MITQLTINGQKYKAHFGLGAAYLFCKDRGIEMHEFDKRFFGLDPEKLTTQYFEDFALLIIAAIKNGMRKTGEDPPLQPVDIINWLNDEPEQFEKVGKLLYDIMPQNDGENQGNVNPLPRKKPKVGKQTVKS